MNMHLNLPHSLLTKLAGLLVLLVSTTSEATIPVDGQLREATAASSPRVGDPIVYQRYSGAASLVGDFDHPRRASALDLAGSGPHGRITGVSTYIVARERKVLDRIRVRLQFWNSHPGVGNSVFAAPTVGGQVDINLVGPFILEAGTPYEVSAEFPKPTQMDRHQALGVSAQVLANVRGGQIVEQDGLAIAYDAGSAPATGVPLAHYAGAAIGIGMFNFEDGQLTSQALALVLRGQSTSHVQCTNWPETSNHLAEEFDGADANGIESRWMIDQNQGDPVLAYPGRLFMSTSQLTHTFPYVRSRGSAIPPTGEFSVRWLSRYTQTSGAGTGTLVISKGLPVNGQGDGTSLRLLENWQHNSASPGYRIRAWTPNPITVVEAPAGQHAFQDIEYCWLSDRIEVWVNGERRLHVPNVGIPRPDSLWTGNSATAGTLSAWSEFDLYSVRVRKPFSDQIFGNGFE